MQLATEPRPTFGRQGKLLAIMAETTYTQKLKSPLWQKRRLNRLNKENFCCQICHNDTQELHVHHLYYDKGKAPWEYPDKALAVLCSTHHEEEHSIQETVKEELFDAFKRAGFTNSSLVQIILGLRLCNELPASPSLVAASLGSMFSSKEELTETYENFKK